MSQTLKFGNKTWATKVGSTLAYNDLSGNYKPLPFAFTRSTSATRVNKEGLIEVVTNDRPRIDYTDTSDGVLLLEKAATNLITYSEDFSNAAWTKLGTGTGSVAIVTSGYAISPDGTQNASRLQCDLNGGLTSSGNQSLIYDSYTSSGSQSLSVYLKSNTGSNQTIYFANTQTSGDTITVTSEWQRFEFNHSTATYVFAVGLRGRSGGAIDDTADVLIYGAQAETNSVASSYIPTQGSATTRVAETASGSGNSEVFNDSEGVLFANISQNNNSFNTISVSDGGTTDRVTLVYQNNTIKSILVHNNNVVVLEKSGYLQNLFHKVAIKYTSSNVSLIVNGFELFTASRGAFADSLNTLQFAQGNGGNNFYGKTKEVGYYDTILTDLEVETLTSYKSWTSMVNELNLNIIYNG